MRGRKMRTAGWLAAFGLGLILAGNRAGAQGKDMEIDLRTSPVRMERTGAISRADRVKVKSDSPSVVRAGYRTDRKDRRIELLGRKQGTATVTVSCLKGKRTVKRYRYHVKVIRSRKADLVEKGKEAFKIQNSYREEKGVAALEWSDELYQFCLYRIKTSGYDEHENTGRDTVAYFGNYARAYHLTLGENLYSGHNDAASAMKAWKKSPGHYHTILNADYTCGAIACHKNVWCAIFYEGDRDMIEGWREHDIREVTVRRQDSGTGAYLERCDIGYYKEGDKWGTLQAAMLTGQEGKKLYLEAGRTYGIYERRAPEGYGKAESVTITVEGDSTVVLRS